MSNITPENEAPNPNNGAQQHDATTTVLPQPNPYASAATGAQATSKGLGIAALVVGIVAFLTGLVPFLGLIAALAAVGLGVFALIKKQPKALAITGTALGGVALLTSIIVLITFAAAIGGISAASDSEPTEVVAEEPAAAPAEEETVEEVIESPAVEEPAAEVPAADLGEVGNPYPQPYVAEGLFGGEKYSLTARVVDANANAAVNNWNQFNTQAPAGFKYVVVELTMTGIDPDGVEPGLAEWDLTLATAEGNQYNGEFIVFGDGMPAMSEGPTLYPGSSFTGFTAYIVPEASQAFLLHDNGEYIAL